MDYGRFRFEQSKKNHAAKKKQKKIQVKEIKFRPSTDSGDYNIKLRNLIKFLENGDKAKVTLRFRGREMAHKQLGADLLKRVEQDLSEYGTVEQFPKFEGRQMIMVIAPKKKWMLVLNQTSHSCFLANSRQSPLRPAGFSFN